jgi:hypothetical protein
MISRVLYTVQAELGRIISGEFLEIMNLAQLLHFF